MNGDFNASESAPSELMRKDEFVRPQRGYVAGEINFGFISFAEKSFGAERLEQDQVKSENGTYRADKRSSTPRRNAMSHLYRIAMAKRTMQAPKIVPGELGTTVLNSNASPSVKCK
jgi:hypothetical protein